MERKRQGYIHELIQTEERYVDDLQLVVEVRGATHSPAPGTEGAGGLKVQFHLRCMTSQGETGVVTLLNCSLCPWRGLDVGDLKSAPFPD